MNKIQNGLLVVSKKDCPTCTMIESLLGFIDHSDIDLTVLTQDDPAFPAGVNQVVDDTSLKQSYLLNIETVPTAIRYHDGQETDRVIGWNRAEWQSITGIDSLGEELPDQRPGCGSKNVDPGMPEILEVKYGDPAFQSRPVDVVNYQDDIELCYERGWSDGLPVVPPTPERVLRMLHGTKRSADEVIGNIPPDLAPCTIEKIAVNAVMAGCKPEYMPVVITAVEAALQDEFCMHGLLATTWFSGPVVIVNGPITRRIGMNSGGNALGQGNRANGTIGRALQLVIRNVGGGKPGGVDRCALGSPGKYTFCFPEDETNEEWQTLAEEKGFTRKQSTVTLFAGDGVQGIMDQQSRKPESLTNTFAAMLKNVAHPKICMAADAILVISPEHARVFHNAGWDRAKFRTELEQRLMRPGKDLIRGAQDIAEGLPDTLKDATLPKFRPGGLQIVRAGGKAGMFSAIIGGWVASGAVGSDPVTREIEE
jgi:hypothetical protein